jgi:hypothetical protein
MIDPKDLRFGLAVLRLGVVAKEFQFARFGRIRGQKACNFERRFLDTAAHVEPFDTSSRRVEKSRKNRYDAPLAHKLTCLLQGGAAWDTNDEKLNKYGTGLVSHFLATR